MTCGYINLSIAIAVANARTTKHNYYSSSVLADYTLSDIPTTVTISALDPNMRECFTGTIIDDRIGLEPDETFTLNIDEIHIDSMNHTHRIETTFSTTVITIIDDKSKFSD